MKNFDIDWQRFFNTLPAYRALSLPLREVFLSNAAQQNLVLARIGEHSPFLELVQRGLYMTMPKGAHIAPAPEYHPLLKALRAMHRNQIEAATTEAFDHYVADNLSRDEWSAFHGNAWWLQGREGLYSKVGSVSWIEGFLKGNTTWEQQYRVGFEADRVAPEARDVLKTVVRYLMERPEPVAFEHLYELCPNRALLAKAVRAGIRYLLLFPRLQHPTLDPMIGLWPGISRRLHRQAAKPPEAVTAVQTFCAPLMVDAMAAVLTACIAEPLRVLAGTYGALYAKSGKQVAARLAHLPDWLPDTLKNSDEERIQFAIDMLRVAEMITLENEYGSNQRFEVTEGGRAWLGMPAKERVRGILDRVRRFRKRDRGAYYQHWEELAEPVQMSGEDVETHKAVLDAFGRIPAGATLPMEDFVAYEARVHNPLVVQSKPGARTLQIYSRVLHDPSEEDLEQHWGKVLFKSFERKLVPIGAVVAGLTEDGRLTVSLSEVGLYLLGLADDFALQSAEAAGAIVVQPNFDIVFMAPSPVAEAELSSFTERHGKHVGAVLKITKKSVWAAAAAGITAESVIAALRTHSSVPIPGNVEREIRGWMGQCRRASIRSALIIRCPDAETATRVLALERTKIERLTETVLELNDPSYRSKLVKRLREIGVFI